MSFLLVTLSSSSPFLVVLSSRETTQGEAAGAPARRATPPQTPSPPWTAASRRATHTPWPHAESGRHEGLTCAHAGLTWHACPWLVAPCHHDAMSPPHHPHMLCPPQLAHGGFATTTPRVLHTVPVASTTAASSTAAGETRPHSGWCDLPLPLASHRRPAPSPGPDGAAHCQRGRLPLTASGCAPWPMPPMCPQQPQAPPLLPPLGLRWQVRAVRQHRKKKRKGEGKKKEAMARIIFHRSSLLQS